MTCNPWLQPKLTSAGDAPHERRPPPRLNLLPDLQSCTVSKNRLQLLYDAKRPAGTAPEGVGAASTLPVQP